MGAIYNSLKEEKRNPKEFPGAEASQSHEASVQDAQIATGQLKHTENCTGQAQNLQEYLQERAISPAKPAVDRTTRALIHVVEAVCKFRKIHCAR